MVSFLSELHCSTKQDGEASGDFASQEFLRTTFSQSDDLVTVYLHLTCFRGLSPLNHFSLLTARRLLLQNSHYQSYQELEDMDAAENIFVDHYDTSEVSQARILCLCFLFLFVVFQQEKNALEVADFCCRNAVQVQLCFVLF